MGGFLRQKVSKLVIGSAACSIAVPGSRSAACATAPVVIRTGAEPLLLSRCQENQGESGPTSLTEAHLEAPHGASPHSGRPLACPSVTGRIRRTRLPQPPRRRPTNSDTIITTPWRSWRPQNIHDGSGALCEWPQHIYALIKLCVLIFLLSLLLFPPQRERNKSRLGSIRLPRTDLGFSNHLRLPSLLIKKQFDTDFCLAHTSRRRTTILLDRPLHSSSRWPTTCAARPTAPRTFWPMSTVIALITRIASSTRPSPAPVM
jgi:hypothetical protein